MSYRFEVQAAKDGYTLWRAKYENGREKERIFYRCSKSEGELLYDQMRMNESVRNYNKMIEGKNERS